MSAKSPSVAYYTRKISISKKSELKLELQDAPIKRLDYEFVCDIIDGLSVKELAYKYNKSLPRIAQWKRSIFEVLHRYDIAQIQKLRR